MAIADAGSNRYDSGLVLAEDLAQRSTFPAGSTTAPTMIPVIDVSLDAPPERRWEMLTPFAPSIRALFTEYLYDLAPLVEPLIAATASIEELLGEETCAELHGLAKVLEMPFEDVLLGNLYYDALKHLWGCTAFAVDAPGGPIHGRNLDWHSEGGALTSATVQFRFVEGGVERYRTVGWPGYLGCLSGVAPGRFAVTLNTVCSDDAAELFAPVSFLIRRTLATAPSFDDAVRILAETPVSSDSLLLVSGTQPGEMAVVERTPMRSAIRRPTNGMIVVTNDYRDLAISEGPRDGSDLFSSSCGRFDRCASLTGNTRPTSLQDAIQILQDSQVRMDITAQHMAFQAATGQALVVLPN